MPVVDFKIVFSAQFFFLLILIYLGRNFLAKRIIELFRGTKIPPLYLHGFRLLLGILLLGKLYKVYEANPLFINPSSFFRIDPIFQLFFHSDYRFLALALIPLVFTILFVFEWRPRLTSTVVFIYSVIGGTMEATLKGSLGQTQHSFHLTALLLLGFVFYYWFFYKRSAKNVFDNNHRHSGNQASPEQSRISNGSKRFWTIQNDGRELTFQKGAKRSNEWMIFPILLFFVGTVYGASFMSKISYLSEAPKWFTGEAVQSAIIEGHYQRVLRFGYDIDSLRFFPQFAIDYKPFAVLLGIGVLLTEFSSMLLLIVSNRLRLFLLISFALFNLGTGIFILAGMLFLRDILLLIYLIIWAAYNDIPKSWHYGKFGLLNFRR